MTKKICFFIAFIFLAFNSFAQTRSQNDIQNTLDSIWKSDQEIRFDLIKLQQEGKMKTEEFQQLVSEMKATDSLNLEKVKSILDQGWPDDLDFQGNQTLFLVIQHADLETQKKYLPVIEQAVQENKSLPSNLALLKDRIALREGDGQIYGSQVFIDAKTGDKFVQKIEDPENVDSLRASVGLPSMQIYLKQSFQMDWSLEQYYNDLPKLEKLLKEKAAARN